MRLEFGNKDHIAIRNATSVDKTWNRLKNRLNCPICGSKAYAYSKSDIVYRVFAVKFHCEHQNNGQDYEYTFSGIPINH